MWKLILGLVIGYCVGAYQMVDANTAAARSFAVIKGIVEGMLQ